MDNEKQGFWQKYSAIFFIVAAIIAVWGWGRNERTETQLRLKQLELEDVEAKFEGSKKWGSLHEAVLARCGVRFQGDENQKTVTHMYNCPIGEQVRMIYTADKKWITAK